MALVHRVVAPNPGPYTGPGTNTWIVEAGPVVVVIVGVLGLLELPRSCAPQLRFNRFRKLKIM